MVAIADLVHQTATTTGTGNFTLVAVNGKQSFNTAFGNGVTTNVFYYYISNQAAAEWEYGTGHMSDATTLVRDTVIGSTNSNAAVNFSAGTKDVVNDLPAVIQSSIASPIQVCDGRLTLESGVPVMATDQLAKTTLYFTPCTGNRIALYDGTRWNVRTFSEISISLSGLTADTNYDAFVYDNSGTPTIDTLVAWTNDTTRATALARQDGVLSKTGALTRRYVGTIRTTATTGQCEFSMTPAAAAGGSHPKLFVWNAYNRCKVSAVCRDSTDSWTYTTLTLRASNNSNNNRISFVCGLAEGGLDAAFNNRCDNSSADIYRLCGIGYDSTSAFSGLTGQSEGNAGRTGPQLFANLARPVEVGFHYVQELEASNATGTSTWFGDGGTPTFLQTGMTLSLEM